MVPVRIKLHLGWLKIIYKLILYIMLIYIDIESIPSGDKPTIDDLKVPGTMSKPETIQKWKDDKEARKADLDEMYRKRALSLTESQVICVAYAIENEPVVGIMRDTERETMEALRDSLLEYDSTIFQRTNHLIGFNSSQFDFPILALRAAKYHVSGLTSLWHVPNPREFHVDVMLEFGLKSRGFMISMEKACKFFGIPSSKESMDGSQVYDYYLAGKGNEIVKYCMSDVEAMRKLWKELNFGGIKTI